MTTPTVAFRRGGAAAEVAEEHNREAAKSRRSNGPDYLSLAKDGEEILVRLLTDDPEVIWVDQHSFIPTKKAPADADNWPTKLTAVCRRDKAFEGHFEDCYICKNKVKNAFNKTSYPQIRVWALAVERELVKGDGTEALGGPEKKGVVVAVRDKFVEIDQLDADGKETGEKLRYPKIIVINQPVNNFYSHFRQMLGLYKTLTDRDYLITRKGSGTDTEYVVTSMDPIESLKPGTPAWQRYLETLVARKIDLNEIVMGKANDAYYAKFFDPAFEVDKDGKVVPAGTAAKAEGVVDVDDQPAPAKTEGGLAPSLRDQIRGMGAPVEPAAADESTDEPPY